MPTTALYNISVTSVSTTAETELGRVMPYEHPTYGWGDWVYVKNAEAATAFASGTVVMNKTTTATPGQGLVCATSTAPHRVIGVAQHAIAAGSFGWILKRGLGLVIADTADFTADTGLIPGNAVAGTADNVAAATGAIFAVALATTTATNKGVCYVNAL